MEVTKDDEDSDEDHDGSIVSPETEENLKKNLEFLTLVLNPAETTVQGYSKKTLQRVRPFLLAVKDSICGEAWLREYNQSSSQIS